MIITLCQLCHEWLQYSLHESPGYTSKKWWPKPQVKKETIQLRPYKWSWASCDHTHQHPTILNRMWISMFHCRREVQTRCMVIQRASKYVYIRIYIYYHFGGHLSLFLDSGGHTLGRRITIQISQNNGNLQVCKRGVIEATTCYIFERFNETPFSLRLKSRAPFDGQQTAGHV